jgi:hypothetical protein
MRRIWKTFLVGAFITAMTLPAVPQALTGSEKMYTFTGRLEASGLALNNVAPRMVTASVHLMVGGKRIGTEKNVVFVPSTPDRTSWVGKFSFTGSVPERSQVLLVARGQVTYPNRRELQLSADKMITVGTSSTIDLGRVPVKTVMQK